MTLAVDHLTTSRLAPPVLTDPALDGAGVRARLAALEQRLAAGAARLLGYPESMQFDYEPLLPFLRFNLDNLGDPYSDLLYGVNSVDLEREVVDWFADLYHLPREQAWGYVTSSGSEGNLYGLYLGREALPDAVLYFSQASHYSVPKAARLLRLPARDVPALPTGELDLTAFEAALRERTAAERELPVIVNLNLGTTMTGAVDDVDGVVDVLRRVGVHRFYLHCDAALSGLVLPFVPGAAPISFAAPIGSISVSGHKWLGAPFPCGLVLTRREHVARISTTVAYIGALDATIGGSRNGQAPLYLWHALATRGANAGLANEVATCLDTARYLHDRLVDLGVDAYRGEHSVTVVFPEPDPALVRRWSLARAGGRAHVVVVPHVTRALVDAFLDDLRGSR